MNATERCPRCNLAPEVEITSSYEITFVCPRHGHMAMGSTLEQAKAHWNHYIAFVKAGV